MRLLEEFLRLSATDLANHLGCVHLSQLDRAAAEGRKRRPQRNDPIGALLRVRGLEHEAAYLEHLKTTRGLDVVEIAVAPGEDGVDKTVSAMRAGADLIYQAPLGNERWYGRADFLQRVDEPSRLGLWSYEVTDAKLATETRAGTVLQLCVYSELLAAIQGEWPEAANVVAPHHDFKPERYRLADYKAYYRLVKRRLEGALDAAPAPVTYPDPVQHCEVCAWWAGCNARRRDDDHLCFVAGISRSQIKELKHIHVDTLERLGDLRTVPRPSRGSREALVRVRDQAAIQLLARRLRAPQHEILEPIGPEHGLALLPAPSAHDLFLDLEGDRLAGDGGREYLFGLVAATAPGAADYTPLWATTPAEEKAAFEAVVDRIVASFRAHPDLHVYHFGAYEPTAFKRLSGRYATRETELDTILRAELFVDLHTIVRHSLKASVESYSIKELEQFYGLTRAQDLREATASRRVLEWAIETKEDVRAAISTAPRTQEAEDLAVHVAVVERYNREDCVSAERLQCWLESLRASVEAAHDIALPRPALKSGEASEKIEETAEETHRVMAALVDDVPVDPTERDEEQRARWLLAHLLEWHRREDKAAWWEYYRLKELPLEDYEEERSALSGLAFSATLDGGTVKRPIHRYSFPPQDHDIRRGDTVCVPPEGQPLGDVENIDVNARTVDIQHGGKYADERPERIFVRRNVPPGTKPQVLLELGRWVAAHGIDAPGEHRAARDLILCRSPRLRRGALGFMPANVEPERAAGQNAPKVVDFSVARGARARAQAARSADPEIEAATRLGAELEDGVLAIQGPPGTGKTFTGSHMIYALLKAGKKIGVTAVSHEVIRNLLKAVCERAAEAGDEAFKCLHKGKPKDGYPDALHAVDDNKGVHRSFMCGEYGLLGGTSWLWARPEFRGALDVLFIDEAGQMSLADVLAVAGAADSLVLLGDPQQLEQPQQASHPPGTQASALEHVLGGAKTIAEDRGLFLHQTRRLHPSICAFTAEVFYEDKLASFPGLERQTVIGAAELGEAGLVFVPVEHEGNQSRSKEEIEAVERIVALLTNGLVAWRDKDDRVGAADAQRSDGRGTVQRSGDGARVAFDGRARGHRRQVPGTGGAGRDRVPDDVHRRGCAAPHGFSLQREPAQRRDIAREGPLHSGRRTEAVRAGLPFTAANAARQRVLPLSGACERAQSVALGGTRPTATQAPSPRLSPAPFPRRVRCDPRHRPRPRGPRQSGPGTKEVPDEQVHVDWRGRRYRRRDRRRRRRLSVSRSEGRDGRSRQQPGDRGRCARAARGRAGSGRGRTRRSGAAGAQAGRQARRAAARRNDCGSRCTQGRVLGRGNHGPGGPERSAPDRRHRARRGRGRRDRQRRRRQKNHDGGGCGGRRVHWPEDSTEDSGQERRRSHGNPHRAPLRAGRHTALDFDKAQTV